MSNGDDNTTPAVNWQTDPDFHALPLAEKHKVLLQVDPDYKGLPPKEQAKALDVIHYGNLGQSEQTGVTGALKGMIPPDPTGGAPFLSKEFWVGKGPWGVDPTKPGTAYSDVTRPLPKDLPTAALTNAPSPSGPAQTPLGNAIYRGASILSPMGAESAEEASARGDTANVATQAAVPAALTLAGPAIREWRLSGQGDLLVPPSKRVPVATSVPAKAGISPEVTGSIGRTIGHATRIPGAGTLGEYIGRKFGTEAPAAATGVESPASILAERQKRMAAYAEMQEDFANRAKQQQKDLANRVADAEKARQKEITDWAKLDKVNEADHQAFADRMSQIEDERQSALADMERFKEQHAAALNARKAPKAPPPPAPNPFAGMTSTAPSEVPQGNPTPFTQRPGGLIPPPSPEPVSAQPTIGSQIAERNKSSILSRGRTLYQPGEEPNLNDPVHAKIINDLQTRSGSELRTMAKNGDRFAAFVLRNMPRP